MAEIWSREKAQEQVMDMILKPKWTDEDIDTVNKLLVEWGCIEILSSLKRMNELAIQQYGDLWSLAIKLVQHIKRERIESV